MPAIQQLYDLQAVDTELGRHAQRLVEVEAKLGDRRVLDTVAAGSLETTDSSGKEADTEADSAKSEFAQSVEELGTVVAGSLDDPEHGPYVVHVREAVVLPVGTAVAHHGQAVQGPRRQGGRPVLGRVVAIARLVGPSGVGNPGVRPQPQLETGISCNPAGHQLDGTEDKSFIGPCGSC